MKQLLQYAFAMAVFTLLSMGNTWAIAPLPGLNITEPLREPIQYGLVSQKRAQRIIAGPAQSQELVSRGLLIVVEFADLHLAEGTVRNQISKVSAV